jgi:inhibitor of KinA sporulation pathway (predicted exonuclease)
MASSKIVRIPVDRLDFIVNVLTSINDASEEWVLSFSGKTKHEAIKNVVEGLRLIAHPVEAIAPNTGDSK